MTSRSATDDLVSLANETDGLAIVNTNDLNGGMKRIADDLAAYYVLGYYTTNTKFDGGLRNIKVRLKSSGKQIRARRQYRAPTEAEIAALASGVGASSSAAPGVPAPPSPYETALVALERASRPFAVYTAAAGKQVTVVAELSAASILAGKWKDGADVDVVASGANGEPVATARGKIEPGANSTSISLPPPTAPAARVTVRLKGTDGGPSADDWILMQPATGTLIGDAVAYRTGPRARDRGPSPRSSSPATSGSARSGPCSRRSIGARSGCSTRRARRCRWNCLCRRMPPRTPSWSRCRSQAWDTATICSSSPRAPAP